MRIRRIVVALLTLSSACGTLEAPPDGPATTAREAGADAAPPADRMKAYVAEVEKDGPIAYWRLDDTSTDRGAKDEIGTLGVVHRFSGGCAPGANGVIADDQAVHFDGTCRIDVDDPNAKIHFDGKKPFSIEAWAKADDGASGFMHIFTRQERSTGPYGGYALLLSDQTTAYGERVISSTENNQSDIVKLAAGAFVHVVLTYDGAALVIYVNGAALGQPHASTDMMPDFAATPYIGAAGATESRFRGILDEIAVYGTALAPGRVKAHHDALAPP